MDLSIWLANFAFGNFYTAQDWNVPVNAIFVRLMRHKPDSSSFDAEGLAKYVRQKRGGTGLRDTAIEIGGISASTLSRVEKGQIPDLDTFIRLCRWMGVPPSSFMTDLQGSEPNDGQSTPDAIAAHFRADRALDPRTAESLSRAVQALYEAAKEGKI